MTTRIARAFRNLIRPKYLAHAARLVAAGTAESHWVTTISDVLLPTAAELNAGVDLTGFARNIPSLPETGNTADTADLSSLFNKRIAADHGGDNAGIDFYMDDDGTDLAYTTLPRATAGFLVIPFYGLATKGTFAVADLVWVYPAEVITRAIGQPGRSEAEFFTSEMARTSDPTERFAIAA